MARKAAPTALELIKRIIGDKWKILIFGHLSSGAKRFGELKYLLGDISQKVLSENLKELEHYKLLNRKIYPEIPPRVEYSLTELGQSLQPVLAHLMEWGLKFAAVYAEMEPENDE